MELNKISKAMYLVVNPSRIGTVSSREFEILSQAGSQFGVAGFTIKWVEKNERIN